MPEQPGDEQTTKKDRQLATRRSAWDPSAGLDETTRPLPTQM
jgi:hypothetical protein